MINYVMSWNDNRPEEQPIDCEQEQVMLSMAKDAASTWDDGNIDEAQKKITKLTDYAESCSKSG